MALRIADIVTYPNQVFMQSWDSTTGEVLTWSEDYDAPCQADAAFATNVLRNAAIVKINACSANTGKFIGHVPTGHP